ncbi:MAG: hypothetical protein M5U28_18095 [Sandaracinaceae bacterium]|nr:hypothetical protein [Sandaracinaceae bacterium]
MSNASLFALATFGSAGLVVALAAALRGRFFATFAAVLLGVQGLVAWGLFASFEPLWPLYAHLQLAVHLHFLSLSRARMRPLLWRALVSVPGLFFAAGTMLAWPWAVAAALGFTPHLAWLPFLVAAGGVVQSLWTREEEVDVALDGAVVDVHRVRRHARTRPSGEARPLSIVQLSDPHLGPLMSVRRLRRICERAVARDPDLVLLTGDFLTMESQADPSLLEEALAPLRALEGGPSPAWATTITRRPASSAARWPAQASACSSTRRWSSTRRSAPCRSSARTSSSAIARRTSRRCAPDIRAAPATCASSCSTIRAPSATCRRGTGTSSSAATRTAGSSAS